MKKYNQCKNLQEENDRNVFENNFNNYINECLEDYENFKLIYFDNSMKAIIQEDNYPLSYNSIEYPYIKYFVVSHYPKFEGLKEKKNEFENKNQCSFDMINSFIDESEKVGIIDGINNFVLNRIFQIYMKYFSLTPFIDNISFCLSLESFNNNNDILLKCKKLLDDNISEDLKDEYFDKLEKVEKKNKKKLIQIQNKFLENLLKKINNKNEYLFKNIRQKINIDCLFEEQIISLKIDKISKFCSDMELISKYIYKDVFFSESKNTSEYVAISKVIEYSNYQKYYIDLNGLEYEMTNILLSNKRLIDKKTDNFIPYLKLFKGNRKNILYNFMNIYPNYIEKLDKHLEESVLNTIDDKDKDIINIYIENSIMSLYNSKKYKYLNKENIPIFKFISEYYEKQKSILHELIKNEESIKENDILESKKYFIIYTFFSIQKIIIYLTENIISEDLSIYEILNNSPEILNISNYAITFFKKHQEFTLKHLFGLYELFEKLIFPYILAHIKAQYKISISQEIYDEILFEFEENKDIEETIFSKNQLMEALRKYISRYLISNDIPNDV